MQRKTLLVGAGGQVGAQMLQHLSQAVGTEDIFVSSRSGQANAIPLDLAALESVEQVEKLFSHHAIGTLYCIGGMTYVDGCESDPDLAYRTNARGPALLAAYAHALHARFIYFSTDYVFDGFADHPGPYSESSETNPINVYGRSKLDGERAVQLAHPKALIIRTTGVYGEDDGQKNYLYTVARFLAQGKPLRVPQDQVSTPTYNKDLVHATATLAEAGASGVYHLGGAELLDRLSFAKAIGHELGLDTSLLQGVTTEELQQAAPRPLASGLRSEKLPVEFPSIKSRSVAEAIRDCKPALEAFLSGLC